MLQKAKTLDPRLMVRRCVACGYHGALLRGGRAKVCARCGCNLVKRPARSYAEMEGLAGQPMTLDEPLSSPRRQERLIHRWLAFLFLTALGFIALLYLATATFSV